MAITPGMVAEAKQLLATIESKAGPELKSRIQTEQTLRPLDQYAGKSIGSAADGSFSAVRRRG